MAKIIANKDCGNAPKKKFILDFLIALANTNVKAALQMLEEDVHLNIVGRNSYVGKDQVKAVLEKDGVHSEITTLEVANIISHGKKCAANGVMHFEDGSKIAFNNIYTFRSHSKNAGLTFIETYTLSLQ